MTEHKWADVLRAIADGKEVQYRDLDKYGWHVMSGVITPLTHLGLEWRIKPERKPDVVRYYNNYEGGLMLEYPSIDSAKQNRKRYCIGTIRVTITHDDNGNPMRGSVEWCDE